MAQPQTSIQIQAPGFAGLNTQDSPIGMDLQFAGNADNCVIDKFGRISSRKGLDALTDDPDATGAIGDSHAETAYEFTDTDGTRRIFFSGNLEGGSTASMWAQDEGGTATLMTGLSATNNNWAYASLSDQCFIAQEGEVVQYTANGTSWQAMTQQPQVVAEPNIIIAGLGHLWVASSASKKSVIEWSTITTNSGLGGAATPWTGSGSGSLDIEEYWPNGTDTIEALAIHNNFLVIFGRSSILVYVIPDTGTNVGPEFMSLSDTVNNMGCIARDSVVSMGTDLLFLDSSGLRSLMRTVQEKSMPLGDMSMNVRDELRDTVLNATGPIRAVYSPEEAFVALIIPNVTVTADLTATYVFDTRRPLESGALRATKWLGRELSCGVRTNSGKLLLGRPGGLYEYTGGSDTSLLMTEDATSGVDMNYATRSQDFGEASRFKFPKQIDMILVGGSQFTLDVSWFYDFDNRANTKTLEYNTESGGIWNVAQWDIDQWGESGGNILSTSVNLWGSGKNVLFRFQGTITDTPLSIQELNMNTLLGRIN